MEEILTNKVAQSSLITLNLEDYLSPQPSLSFDMAPCLFQGLILREKDFREFVANHDWSAYSGANVAIFCSVDAIVPTWAYMLVANRLQPFAHTCYFGTPKEMELWMMMQALTQLQPEQYQDQRVVVKGCGDKYIPEAAYVEVTRLLTPHVKSIFYGEPCSTVPIYKRK